MRKQCNEYNIDKVSKVKRKHHFPSPLTYVLALIKKCSLSVILIGSIIYIVKMTLQTSLAAQYIDIYDLSYMQASLIYLPFGVGGGIASQLTGV
jgi:hypothetical protein